MDLLNKAANPFPTVAIVGRPNVGKSTFFNSLVGKRKAIVQEESGTTRDRIYAAVRWGEQLFTLIDTGGMRFGTKGAFDSLIDREVEKAIHEANVIIFMVDGRSGITSLDEELAEKLRNTRKIIFLAVNKLDVGPMASEAAVFHKFGFKHVFPISSVEGLGIGDMLDQAVTHLPKTAETPQIPHFSLAIVGEPNVGKSTLLNAVLNEERAIVSEIAGTTRDSLEEVVKYKKHFIRLIDTAGMRHKKKIKQASDLFSLSRAKQSIQESDVTFLLFDAEIGIRRDTKAIAGFLEGARKPALLVANKWDLVKKTEQALYEIDLKAELGFLKYAPLVFISARDKKNLTKVMDAGVDLWERSRQHIPTKELNRFLEIMKARRLPSPALRLKFLTQTSATPQQFVCFVRHKDVITKNYHAHFENELTSTFHLEGIPIQLFFREVGQKD